MGAGHEEREDWKRLLAAERRLQIEADSVTGVEGAGLRQLRPARPIEVNVVEGLRIPTLPEMVRIKAWLFLTRDSTRDLLDAAALLDRLGETHLREAFASFDEIYERGPRGGSPLVELVDRLAAARPADRAAVDLKT